MQYTQNYESPLGRVLLASDGESLTGLWFDGQKYFGSTLTGQHEQKALPVFGETVRWLDIYFGGQEPDFTPPLSMQQSSSFRREVWEIMLAIPFGQMMTYGAIAAELARQIHGLCVIFRQRMHEHEATFGIAVFDDKRGEFGLFPHNPRLFCRAKYLSKMHLLSFIHHINHSVRLKIFLSLD